MRSARSPSPRSRHLMPLASAGSRRPALFLRLAVGALSAAVLLGACSGGGSNQGVKGSDIGDIEGFEAPALLGLKVQKEEIGVTLDKARGAYVDATVLYSIRSEDDLVQATLQISRFTED